MSTRDQAHLGYPWTVADTQRRTRTDLETTVAALETRVAELEAVVAKLGAPVVEATRRLSSGRVADLIAADPYIALEVLADWTGGSVRLCRGQVVRADQAPLGVLATRGLQLGLPTSRPLQVGQD